MNNKSKGGVCDSCKVLLNNLIVSQFKEEPAHSPAVKQVLEEECKAEEKVPDHYGSDNNVDFDNDSLPAESNNVSEDEEDFDVEDPEYHPEDQVQGKPTVIKIINRGMSGGETDYQCDQCTVNKDT